MESDVDAVVDAAVESDVDTTVESDVDTTVVVSPATVVVVGSDEAAVVALPPSLELPHAVARNAIVPTITAWRQCVRADRIVVAMFGSIHIEAEVVLRPGGHRVATGP